MKKLKSLFTLFITTLLLFNCFEDRDDVPIEASTINNFVWNAMNSVYLYNDDVPDLADDRFSSDAEFNQYLNNFSSPEQLFESLLFDPNTTDRFSFIVDDYIALEQQFSGVFVTNGMEFSFYAAPNSSTEVIGVVRLVLPNSDADNKGIQRGDLFSQIDGTTLNRDNVSSLLNQNSYTISLGSYNDNGTPETSDDSIVSDGLNITLNKLQFTENPIFIADILPVNGENVGYLMYNGFTRNSENELNTVFANFKANNTQHLVLDLRYNPGGSVRTTTFLASMITGQFVGDIFEKLIYNENLQALNTDFLFANTLPNGNNINSLGIDKIYVLTTARSASASEGLINGLAPYIEVVQIGENTTGKTQASRTFYDSPDLNRSGANPAHTYAIQPLVADGVNINNETVPGTGLPPTIGFEFEERPLNLGILGNVNEPMLALAIADIANSAGKKTDIKSKPILLNKINRDSNDFLPFTKGGMIAD